MMAVNKSMWCQRLFVSKKKYPATDLFKPNNDDNNNTDNNKNNNNNTLLVAVRLRYDLGIELWLLKISAAVLL